MDELLENKQMENMAPTKQAEKAIFHILRRIHREPDIAACMGYGTESFSLLTESAAALTGLDLIKLRKEVLGIKD